MDFNWRQIDTYTSVFNDFSLSVSDSLGDLHLDHNNVFDKLCVLDLSNNIVEIPVFMKGVAEDTIKNRPSVTKVVCPLYSNSRLISRRTADTIIRDFFCRGSISNRLQKIVTNKGEVYYGMRGLVLDANFNPLIFITLTLDKESKSYTNITVYIHPEVFLNTGGLIHKTIIKKIIPFYVSHPDMYIRGRRHFGTISSDIKPHVVIEDAAKRFIQTPTKPSPQHCSDEILNQVLIDNIEDVLNQIVWE